MTATAPAAEITHATARGAYYRVTDRIRERHDPPANSAAGATRGAEDWEVATVHVVMGLMTWEAVAVFRYLAAQRVLAMPDVVLIQTLATRLGLQVKFERRELLA